MFLMAVNNLVVTFATILTRDQNNSYCGVFQIVETAREKDVAQENRDYLLSLQIKYATANPHPTKPRIASRSIRR